MKIVFGKIKDNKEGARVGDLFESCRELFVLCRKGNMFAAQTVGSRLTWNGWHSSERRAVDGLNKLMGKVTITP